MRFPFWALEVTCTGPVYAIVYLGLFWVSWRANRFKGDPLEFAYGWNFD